MDKLISGGVEFIFSQAGWVLSQDPRQYSFQGKIIHL